jgi:IclR family pca regulon transcriptional regulator
MPEERFEDSDRHVRSVTTSIRVPLAFDRDMSSATLSQVAVRAGLSRVVTRRLLLTLRHLGCAGCRGPAFFFAPRVLERRHSHLASLDLTELAPQGMERLLQRIREICSVARLLPAFATSMGRVKPADSIGETSNGYACGQNLRFLASRTLHTARAVKELLVAFGDTQAAIEQAIAFVGWLPLKAMRSVHA